MLDLLRAADLNERRVVSGLVVIIFLFPSLCCHFAALPCSPERDHEFSQQVGADLLSLPRPLLHFRGEQFLSFRHPGPFVSPRVLPHLLVSDDLLQLHQLPVTFVSSVQLLRRAARPADLLRGVRERVGVRGRVTGACSADHHQLPHRVPGCVRPAAGNARHALGRLPRGVCVCVCSSVCFCLFIVL